MLAVAAAALVACGDGDDDVGLSPDGEKTTTTAEATTTTREPTTTASPAPTLPPEVVDPARPPEPGLFLPDLEGYQTEDVAVSELAESFAHGLSVLDVRERLVLDEQGFVAARISVVVLPAETEPDAVLAHRFGAVPRQPVEIAGVDMSVVEAEPHDALAWLGPDFVVLFERGQEVSDEWLHELAAATVDAVRRT